MSPFAVARPDCTKCEVCPIHNLTLCRAADRETVSELSRISHDRFYRKGETIILRGDEANFVGNIISGVVKLSNTSRDGHEQLVGLLFPSDFLGRAFAETSRFSYEAATDVHLCQMERRSFEALLSRHPEIEHELLVATLDELDAVREWSAMMSGHRTMERLATFLFTLARRSESQHSGPEPDTPNPVILLPISRHDIADYLGTTPETLSRNFQSLVRQGVIRQHDVYRLELLDEDALIARTGETREELQAMIGNSA